MEWNGLAIPNPKTDGISIKHIHIGSAVTTVNGTTLTQYVSTKREVTVVWEGLSKSELTDLLTKHTSFVGNAARLDLPVKDARSMVVTSILQPYVETSWYSGGEREIPFYGLTIIFREV